MSTVVSNQLAWEQLFSQPLSDIELRRLSLVKEAIESGEFLFTGDLSSLSKNKALALYTRIIDQRRPQLINQLLTSKPTNFHLITEMTQFEQLLTWLNEEPSIVLESQHTGSNVFHADAMISGLSLTLPTANQHVYIPLRHQSATSQLSLSVVFNQLKPYLENVELKKIMFNAKPTLHLLRKEHIKLKGLIMDTQVAAHLLNENEKDRDSKDDAYSLKSLVENYAKFLNIEQPLVWETTLFGNKPLHQIDINLATIFSCQRTRLIQAYHEFICRQFARLPRLKEVHDLIENPLIEVCVEMEQTGLLIDVAFTEAYEAQLTNKLAPIKAELKTWFGDINLNSGPQLQKAIYDDLGLRDPDDETSRKIDSKTLAKLNHPAIELLQKYKDLTKLLNTYVQPFLKQITAQHRLHGNFDQCGAKTGRFSSHDPNLQNFPDAARKMVIPATGKIIVGIDYSQIEPRFLSHITQDPSFMQAYIEGRDLYSEIASQTFNLPISECGDGTKWRKLVKTGMLATMYGTSAYTLGKQLEIPEIEAKEFINNFFTSYPVMKAWTDQVTQFTDTNGYVETAWGRKRRFMGHQEIAKKRNALHHELSKKLNKETFSIWEEKSIPYATKKAYGDLQTHYSKIRRQSVNSIIQGSAADLMKIALIKLHQFLESKGPEWRLLATIHDEVLFEIPASATREEIETLASIQRDAVQLTVPMKVDVEVCQRWGCGMSLDEWFKEKENPLSLSQLL